MARVLLAVFFLPSLLFCGARAEIGAGPCLPGTALTVRFYPSPFSLSPCASAFHQQAAFYPADMASPGGLDYALLAIPLETPPGTYRIRIRWRESGALRRDSLKIRVLALTGKTRVVRLPEKAVSALQFLAEDKPLLDAAYRGAEGRPIWRGCFLNPAPSGRLSQGFGVARLYLPGGYRWRHKGLDLAVPSGTTVVAANDAVVLLAREGLKSYGGLVVLSHGYGLCSTYMHLSKVLVSPGQRVAKGAVIALSGAEGIATGPHLHWQMNLRGFAIDPRPWMDKTALAALK
jgi:murein DD-endopeptidase MepM/ murein hydrolase activator NlpD